MKQISVTPAELRLIIHCLQSKKESIQALIEIMDKNPVHFRNNEKQLFTDELQAIDLLLKNSLQ